MARMERWIRWGVDIAASVAWAAVVTRFEDVETGAQWAAFLGSTVLAGFVSGRYRVIAFAAVALPVAAVLFPVDSCESGCEDDLALWFTIAFATVFFGALALVMAAGVFLRQRLFAKVSHEPRESG